MDKRKEAPMPDVCKHGSLRRSCEICERDEEITRLTERVRELEAENLSLHEAVDAYAIVCRGHSGTLTGIVNLRRRAEKAEQENARLKAELAAARGEVKSES